MALTARRRPERAYALAQALAAEGCPKTYRAPDDVSERGSDALGTYYIVRAEDGVVLVRPYRGAQGSAEACTGMTAARKMLRPPVFVTVASFP